jgi:ABC-type multidrug transport system ATPase subunit
VLNKGEIAADDTPQNLARSLRNYSSYVAVIEGNPELVNAALSVLEEVEEVRKLGAEGTKPLDDESGDVYEYLIRGKDNRDIRRSVSLALSKAGCILLNTKQRDVSLENVFIELINTDRELTDDSGAKAGI